MRKLLFVLPFVLLASTAHAKFIGTLKFAPDGCEAIRNCKLVYDFGYIAPNGWGWQTKAGDVTDGASIPSWAQPFIGKPFEPNFIKAAVIHDHYCDRHVRSWRDTHRVFYDALIESGVPRSKAKIMYYGVLIGGPKWVDLIKGSKCKLGTNCTLDLKTPVKVPDATIMEADDGATVAFRAANYQRKDFAAQMKAVEALIKANGKRITLDKLDELAKKNNPNDFFFKTGSSIPYDDPNGKYPLE